MIKKTRININTSFGIYLKTIIDLLFRKNIKILNIFLNDLKKQLNTENLLLTSQGRVAAYNIFKVITSETKKEIIVSPYTLTEVINAIVYAGAIPIYVDIDIKTGLPLEDELEKKINPRTAGIVITHLFSKKEDLIAFKDKYFGKIIIIEDVAINLGAKLNDKEYLGTVFDYGFYSFGIMKNLCTFHGGALFARDKEKLKEIEKNISSNEEYPFFSSLKLVLFCILIDIAYSNIVYNLFTHHILKLSFKKLDKIMYPGVYPNFPKNKPLHYNYKFQESFAIAGITNLKNLKSKIMSRVENVKLYQKYLMKNLHINNSSEYIENSFLEYPILLKKNSNRFLSKELLKLGYDIRHTWYINSVTVKQLNYKFDDFPNCDLLHKNILSLPTHSKIREIDIKKISNLINKYEK